MARERGLGVDVDRGQGCVFFVEVDVVVGHCGLSGRGQDAGLVHYVRALFRFPPPFSRSTEPGLDADSSARFRPPLAVAASFPKRDGEEAQIQTGEVPAHRPEDRPRSGEALSVRRLFTQPGVHPFDTVEWELRTAAVGSFRQEDVEFPKTWSQNATNIVAQKYFRGQLDLADARALGQADGRARRGHDRRLGPRARLLRLRGGRRRVRGRAHATSCSTRWRRSTRRSGSTWASRSSRSAAACFILSVEDTMDSILDWNTKEGKIFRGGSGSGINLSNIRGSMEPLAKGGTASGPVSFMRGADAWAGTIKSGGKTRRAAKMVVLDVDHPDIREFIWCKAKEEDKAAALRDAGFDMSIDGDGFHSIQYQNANNSVRVTDEFMHAVENDDGLAPDRAHDRRADRRADQGARADARDRRGGLALRRPGRPVRHDDQPVAHEPEHGPDQRV